MAASPLHKTYVCNIKGNGKVILCNDKVKDFKKFGFQVLKIYSGISDEKQVWTQPGYKAANFKLECVSTL